MTLMQSKDNKMSNFLFLYTNNYAPKRLNKAKGSLKMVFKHL